ncbi:MAG: hypothetical protein IJ362_07890 [Oscillospiraceae bacterium]|nr:hypothetical protein [Oscillospiraceae bacterium]
MAFNLNKAMAKKDEIIKSFIPIELNEATVQELFNRCIANASTQEVVTSFLFPKAFGYDGSEKPIRFDKALLLKNKKTIEYLFGQLHRVHFPAGSYKMTADDFNTTYQGIYWAGSTAALLKLLYLGATVEVRAITPFKADTSTSVLSPSIKPTLSPKDPGFDKWWEENIANWE